MLIRYPVAILLTSLLLAAAHLPPRRHTSDSVHALYSARALRRARTILQLRLLELRKEHLEQLRKAIERGIPIDKLLEQKP